MRLHQVSLCQAFVRGGVGVGVGQNSPPRQVDCNCVQVVQGNTGQRSQGLFPKPSYLFDRIVKKTHLVESESGDIESY